MKRSAVAWVGVVLAASAARADTLALADAVRLARLHHPTVEAQRGQLLATRGRGEQAWAPLLPYLTGGIAYQPQTPNLPNTPALQRELLTSNGTDTVIDTAGTPTVVACRTPGVANCAPLPTPPTLWTLRNFWSMNFGLSWTLWDWGASLYGLKSARAQTAAAEVGVRVAQQDVVLDAKLAFFGALAADEALVVARDAEATYREHVSQTRAFHDSGLRTGIDVATAESALASVTITLSRAQSQAVSARALLAQAIGTSRGGDWTLVAPPDAFDLSPDDQRRVAAPTDALTDAAWAHRPELLQLALGERANAAAVDAARGRYLPALTLGVAPSWAGPAFDALTGNLTIGLALSYPASGMSPLFVHGQMREAWGNLAITRAERRAALDGIRQETVTARAQLAAARDEVAAAAVLVDAAARQRQLAEGRYTTGVGNIIELYDALLTDVNARFQRVQARLDLASARARLQHALGEED
jgi:outer membrane protein